MRRKPSRRERERPPMRAVLRHLSGAIAARFHEKQAKSDRFRWQIDARIMRDRGDEPNNLRLARDVAILHSANGTFGTALGSSAWWPADWR